MGGLIAAYVSVLMRSPQEVESSRGAGGAAELTLQTVAALGPNYSGNPNWVSYLVKDSGGEWIHSTKFTLPANALVRVTILQYDTATGLRNPLFARPQGTTGNVIQLDGKTVDVIDPDLTSHTFAVPQLGVFVPLAGVADNAENQCAAAPCTLAQAHRTITGQTNTLDLVVLLLVANAVQNGIIGDDISVTGAVIGAVSLFGINELFNRSAYSSAFVSRVLEGEPSTLIQKGKPIPRELRRQGISLPELRAIARRQGFDDLGEVETAILETNGVVTMFRKGEPGLYHPAEAGGLRIGKRRRARG